MAWHRILVPTDLSGFAQRGVVRAAEIARLSNARVLLVFVVEKMFFPPLPMAPSAPVSFRGEGDILGEAVAFGESRLQELRAAHFAGLDVETKVVVAAGAAAGLLDTIDEWHPDLVVVASHGRSAVMHLLLGSTAEKVVRHAPCEVLVVRSKA
jgi:nucleotide-binding universal stress UspA family protein